MKFLMTLVGLCCCNILLGQIKIGDNPQNIDASSVLELESNSRVLVITRINTQQMNALTPLPGAIVYNTDIECIHFFDGVNWLNLCEALGLSLTADPLVNPAPTIVITQTGENYNFEVGEIRGTNITDFSISGVDIQNNSITEEKLAPDSVGSEELRDNTVADAEIDYNQVTLSDFLNDAGFITGTAIVSTAPNNAISDNGGAYYDNTALLNDIAANTAAIASDGDTNSNNEIQNLSISGNTLSIANGNSVDLSGFNNSGSDDQNLTGASLGPGNVLQIDIENGNSTTVDLSSLSGTGTDDQNLTSASLSPANVLQINIENGNPATVDLSSLSGTGSDDQTLSLTGNQINIENGNSIDLTPILGGGSTELADQITIVGDGSLGNEFEVNDGSINSTKITDGTINSIDLANEAVTPPKIAPGNPGQFLNTNGAGNVAWADVPPSDDDQTAIEVPFTPTGNTLAGDVQNAIEELQLEIDGISAGGAANPTDELQNLSLAGNVLSLTPPASPSNPIDLSFLVDDADPDPTNEYNTGISFDGTNLTITDGGGNQSVNISSISTDDQQISTSGAAGNLTIEDGNTINLNVDDGDADPNNEIQSITSTDGSISLIQTGDDYDLAVSGGNTDDQNLIGANLVGANLTIDIEDGTSATADLSALATDAELAALNVDDADADPTNEIQSITSTDGSINLVQTGNDYDVSVAGGSTDDQNLTGATLVGTDLTIDIEDGTSTTADLSTLATDAELAALNVDDADADPTNEIQAITSTDGSVTLVQTGDDYDLSVAGGSTDDQNLTGATLVGTDLTIDIEDGTSTTADLSTLATDAELAALNVDDADADPNNEIQSITSTDGSVTLVQTGDDYDLSVAGGSTDDQNLTGATLVGTDLTIDIEDGTSTTADLSALATDAELAALNVDDADADPTNEIQAITSTDGSVTLVQTGDDYDLSVAGGSTDDQNLTGATLVGTDLTIDIEDGTSTTADLSTLATDAELAALNVDDADADPTNEIQAITSTDGSVTLVQTGDDYDLSVAGGGTDDQNLTGATLVGTDLTIDIEDGTSTTADLSTLATDAELAALNVDDADADPNNEIQSITSTDGSVTLVQTDDDYDLSVAGAGSLTTDATLTGDGSIGNPLGVAAGGITSVELSAGSVSGGAGGIIADNSITASDLQNDSVDQAEIRIDAVGSSEIESGAVATDEILDGTILDVDVSGSANIAGTKINPDFGGQDVITSGDFISGGITLLVPDYVFEYYFEGYSEINDNYKFRTLNEIEEFIKINQHLPGITSYNEYKSRGNWSLTNAFAQKPRKN